MTRTHQRGTTLVEFALAGAVVLMVLFACFQVSLLLYSWNTLGEGVRRAARVATVCPPNHPSVYQAALLNAPGGTSDSRFVNGLTTANVAVDYLDAAGAPVATPAQIRFVRVSIVDYEYPLTIPFVSLSVPAPSFATTLPIESRGYQPDSDSFECPGG